MPFLPFLPRISSYQFDVFDESPLFEFPGVVRTVDDPRGLPEESLVAILEELGRVEHDRKEYHEHQTQHRFLEKELYISTIQSSVIIFVYV